ncbi:MAG TPA: nucleotide pyrophosphatase/phosphodiesterase family protein [Pirellulaceae bacterium]|nr:nucleotide pyrophosphatase/phosphodiesterase family protein [Pirellulaceae bacterium]
MYNHVILLSIPGLRSQDLAAMPNLSRLTAGGDRAMLTPSFPCVTWPVQANMLTGKLPREHGVVANGFYWRETHEVEMWTAWNDKIQQPQIWDLLHTNPKRKRESEERLTSAVWFPMLSKGCGADYICMPKPVHNPDGSESLWCYTKPVEMYGTLRDTFGHFPLQHFWGPLANIKSTAWIADSAAWAMREFRPNFFYIYLPHLDYAAQKTGPDSPQALAAVKELDDVLGKLFAAGNAAYTPTRNVSEGVKRSASEGPLWLIASEYVITPVDHVTYPNRTLREAGLLTVKNDGTGELIDFANTPAWALVDHQFSHVFVKDRDAATIQRAAELFRGQTGIAEVLAGNERGKYALDHERSGDVILISTQSSWQAYYYWLDDANAPKFARTVDIHNKPGYDPVELHFDFATKSIPLDATLTKGSHGAPATTDAQRGVLLSSKAIGATGQLRDTDLCKLAIDQFRD